MGELKLRSERVTETLSIYIQRYIYKIETFFLLLKDILPFKLLTFS